MVLNTPEIKIEGHPEFIVRPITMDDLETALALIQAEQLETQGATAATIEDIRSDWQAPGFDLASATMAVFTPEGRIVAFQDVWDLREIPVRPHVNGYTLPEYRGLGLGTVLLRWAEQRCYQVFARVTEDARVVMEAGVMDSSLDAKQLLENMGMVNANRSWLHMRITMTDVPQKPTWPEGFTIASLAETNRLEDTFRALRTAWQDHRGSVEESFEVGYERFLYNMQTDTKFDPAMHFTVMDGETIAGIVFCRSESWDDPSEAYVKTLAVVPEYRQKGLGLGLLLHALGYFWEHGRPTVGLFVDGASITGATRLYEKAGMHIHKAYNVYEKELRPGRELSAQ